MTQQRIDEAKVQQDSMKYGCHCDLEPGGEPDGCVIDYGVRLLCVYASRNNGALKNKEDCSYWKPVVWTGETK